MGRCSRRWSNEAMSLPWLQLDTLRHFYSRRVGPGTLLLAGPRRKAATGVIEHLKGVEGLQMKFCGYFYWWVIEGNETEIKAATRLIRDSLRPWRLPDLWLEAARAEGGRGLPGRWFRTSADGYICQMPRDESLVRIILNAQVEFGDDAHLEWSASGFEWVLRRKALHRRIRATLNAHGFRPKSPVFSVLNAGTQGRSLG